MANNQKFIQALLDNRNAIDPPIAVEALLDEVERLRTALRTIALEAGEFPSNPENRDPAAALLACEREANNALNPADG